MAQFKYQATVIIPIYNAEVFLRECLDSLLQQTISQKEMEVLMIDDGSIDGSLMVCKEYEGKYENFKLICQENQGVSAARNNGIRQAQGKYILYLDSDDMLSAETVKNVTYFFDEHYDDVDVITYNLSYLHQNGKKTKHYRQDYLVETGIYDVWETRYIHLTTMNIAVKNEKKYFDEDLIFHEDEMYIAELVMQKGKYGYVAEAEYLYLQHGGNVTSTKANPYYIFEQSMSMYERLFDEYINEEGKISLYIQELVLNDLNWKLKADCLYPYHYEESAFIEAKERIRSLLQKIDMELILKHPNIDLFHMSFGKLNAACSRRLKITF